VILRVILHTALYFSRPHLLTWIVFSTFAAGRTCQQLLACIAADKNIISYVHFLFVAVLSWLDPRLVPHLGGEKDWPWTTNGSRPADQ
jgi:hypothetical protein